MKSSFALLAVCSLSSTAIAAAILPRESPCYFGISARGPPNGTILEDGVGENRIGGTYPPSKYTLSNNALSTAYNQTCLIQPTTSQFECVVGATSTTSFTLANDGSLLYDGCPEWWACEVDGPAADGSWDIYGDGLVNKTGCETVTLITGGSSCVASGTASSSAPSSTTTSAAVAVVTSSTPTSSAITSASTTPSATATAASCPTTLGTNTSHISPSFILPISSAAPNTTFAPTNGSVSVSTGNSTILNFAIPGTGPYDSSADSMCALLFLFPTASKLADPTAPFFFSGTEEETGENGGLDFTLLSEVADATTTWNTINSTQTSVLLDFGTVAVVPGNSYTVAKFECAGDRKFSVQVSSVGNVEVDYVQDDRASVIGAFVVPCV